MSNLICRTFHHVTSAAIKPSSPAHNLYLLQAHPFSSSTEIEPTANQRSFAVTYLVNSFGFPPKEALSASRDVNFETPDKAESVLAVFRNHGFTKTQISDIVRKYPRVLSCDPKKTLFPKMEFFKSKGFSSSEVARFLASDPSILHRSLENKIIPSFNFFKDLIQSEKQTVLAVRRSHGILLFRLQTSVAPNIEILQKAGVPKRNIVALLTNQPRALRVSRDRFRQIVEKVEKMGINPLKMNFVSAIQAFRAMNKSTWEKKVDVYKKWGWSDDEILVAFGKHPKCMMVSENKIMGTMNYLVNEMGLESSSLLKSPVIIGLSLERRIIPRCEVYQVLLSKGLIKKNGISFPTLLKLPENQFLRWVMNLHVEEEAPKLLKLYEEKVALAKKLQ